MATPSMTSISLPRLGGCNASCAIRSGSAIGHSLSAGGLLTKRPVVVNSTISLGWVRTSLTASPLAVSRFPFGALRYRKDRVVGRRCDKEDIVLRIVSEPGRSQDQRG